VGRERDVNEDQFLIADIRQSKTVRASSLSPEDQTQVFGDTEGKLFVVADGIGGHTAGQRASTIAVETVVDYLASITPSILSPGGSPNDHLKEELKKAIQRCQDVIESETSAMPQRTGMGTTLTMAYIVWPLLYVAHAGDSRCYLLRGSKLQRLTRDHTVGQEMLEAGALSPAQAERSYMSNMLWNTVGGGSSDLAPEVYTATLEPRDVVLLCTDGLTYHVSEDEIAEMLAADDSAEQICRMLVDAANEGGGSDNTTAVVVRILEGAQGDA
jgi:protein phosphatase